MRPHHALPRDFYPRNPAKYARDGRGLTPGQLRVLMLIVAFYQRVGHAPSVRDLARMIGSSNPNAVEYSLRRLRAKGYVEWEPILGRTIRPLVKFVTVEA